ncbi:MAG TPA: bacterial transcriptional activator domain-containing protein [Verrucomicrobiae bacterium]|jgi:tetratricopeptide (TPR) repeat protein|nr:bacterial transcriptional activator domain-containing protein [Verrucomicrobiae bacterium]
MKKILVTVVLGAAALAAAQTATQPAQSQPSAAPAPAAAQPAQTQPSAAPAAAPTAAPVIKDPAEYNAYVGAIGQKDAAQISGLEAFLTQYPNSIMKTAALQTLMQDYQQAGNQAKTLDAATRLLAADPTNERAMFLLAYFDRLKAQSGDPNAAQDLADAKKFGQMGLDGLPKFTKPDGMSDADFQKMKDQMTGVFNAALGLAALTDKDYDTARKDLRAAVDSSPDFQKDFSVVYPLALAYAGPTPPDPKLTPDPINAIWFAGRASVVAPNPQYQQQIEKYAKGLYKKYHAGDDGWDDVLAQIKANPVQPSGFTIKPAPTPAEQAHNMVAATPPDKMDFATWEFVLSNGSQEDQDAVWNTIKGKPVYMNGTVISATATEFDIAASSDDIDAKKADITLTFEEKVPLRLIPKAGASLDFQGNPASYTPNPFMMTMEKGLLPKPKVAAPVHHKPASN